ncbi:MAG: tRNA (adenosine(37)-N6)-threonylcarbamoyltransferase complex ATPase subunit type 1 TsaE [Ruminococcaceae bacterium]|nr:tRNA (adenosine(37)-N6)-threonylcarbamoyltransferase complex ATPase subunit type 1 TsaE [Oscillospiraceae bacterium]
MEKVIYSESVLQTENAGYEFAGMLKAGDFVALNGELGAGKTAFTRGIVAKLVPECAASVHSPTFTIVNEYEGEGVNVYHFDFYRLKNEDDLYACGFDDYFSRGGVVVAEWADMFDAGWNGKTYTVSIKKDGEKRIITIC